PTRRSSDLTSTGPVITSTMSASMSVAPTRGQKPTYSNSLSCTSISMTFATRSVGQPVLPRNPPEIDRHAHAERGAGQECGRYRDPHRHALLRPQEQPHQQAPEDAADAAHPPRDLPEAHEWRRRNGPSHAP